MRRREFITLVGGVAAMGPLAARAQQREGVRRIGMLIPAPADDRQYQARVAAFLGGLQQLGWIDGRNVRIDTRWPVGTVDIIRKYAGELVALRPDVVVAFTSAAVSPLREATSEIPIVFAIVADAVGAGFVESLARPGGNVTGFITFEYALGGKWLELLKEIAPRTTRVAVLRDLATPGGAAEFGAIQTAALSFGVEPLPIDMSNEGEIARAVTQFAAAGPDGGLIITTSPASTIHRELIIALAARLRLPAVYYARYYVAGGGLISYGADILDQCKSAAGYVDRILKGEKPRDLPVQGPTKYEMAINRTTAKALGLSIPQTLLVTADEVIE